MGNILIIDDEEMMCELLSRVIMRLGHEADYALTLKQGLWQVSSKAYDVVFLDVGLPDGSGLDALPKIKESVFSPEIIIITGVGDPDGAEIAIRSGAWDYIEKSSSTKDITLSLGRALQFREQRKILKPAVALKREGIIGESPKIKASLDLLAQAANSNANVLITGETGTGKELFAKAIHLNGSRRENNFVVLDCAALPETLVESMLFGHEKGAFTGADVSKEGLVKQADGGTLFLDEVGELPLSVQKAFLRVLQEHRFRPIGGKREIESDFRLVAATNRNLQQTGESGAFREDLLFRIQTITIALPPLRECPEDIREIAVYHINRVCKFSGTDTKGFSNDFFQVLSSYHWPGNVRELINTMEKVLAEAYEEPVLFPKHLPSHIRVSAVRRQINKKERPNTPSSRNPAPNATPLRMRTFLDSAREQYLKDLLAYAEGNIRTACELSGLSRAHLYQLLKKYNITLSG